MEEVALRVRQLYVGYGRAPDIISGVDLTLKRGETAAIVGASGGGKSTLLKAVAGLVPLRAGQLEVMGFAWPRRPPRGSVGYVPQRLGLVRHATVLTNVLQGASFGGSWMDALLGRTPRGARTRALEAIHQVGLADKSDEPVRLLSGGQQRRTAVARALAQDPRILLADEFLAELDPVTLEALLETLKQQQRETGMALLMVEHQLDVAMRAADTVYRLKGGVLVPLEE